MTRTRRSAATSDYPRSTVATKKHVSYYEVLSDEQDTEAMLETVKVKEELDETRLGDYDDDKDEWEDVTSEEEMKKPRKQRRHRTRAMNRTASYSSPSQQYTSQDVLQLLEAMGANMQDLDEDILEESLFDPNYQDYDQEQEADEEEYENLLREQHQQRRDLLEGIGFLVPLVGVIIGSKIARKTLNYLFGEYTI